MSENKAILHIENCYSNLYTTDQDIKKLLWSALRFREKNYYHNSRYRRKLWDGYKDFFNKTNGKFLTGLLPEIKAALDIKKIPYTIVDKRDTVKFNCETIDAKFLNQWLQKGEAPIELYDYQVILTNMVIKHSRGLVQSPTASGKTNILISILKALPQNTPTLVLANKKSLVQQNYDEISKWGFKNVGLLYDKHESPNIITCATVQSLHKIEKILPKIKVLVVDEIHEMMSKVPKKFYNKMSGCSVRVGISATPFKFGGKEQVQKYSVKGYFGPIFKVAGEEGGKLTTKSLQKRKILSDSRCIFYPIDEPQIPYDIYMDAVTNGIAESFHFHKVVTKLTKTLSGRTLILVERISHGDALASLIPGALWVRGQDSIDTRKLVINKLQQSDKDIVAIATKGIFNTGINIKAHNLINAAGGQAEHEIIQRLGRGLRTATDKHILHYIDFIFKINDYLYKHSKNRVKILTAEGHEVIIKESLDF